MCGSVCERVCEKSVKFVSVGNTPVDHLPATTNPHDECVAVEPNRVMSREVS